MRNLTETDVTLESRNKEGLSRLDKFPELPESKMEKALIAADAVSGLMMTCALVIGLRTTY